MQKLSADFSRRNYGRARLPPSQNDSDWRFAISDWWMSFLEGSAPALPKIFGTSGDAPSKFSPNEFGAQKKSVKSHVPCPLSLTGYSQWHE
jgi:hypothetical protein